MLFKEEDKFQTMPMEEAETVLAENSDIILVDVRTTGEYEKRNMKGSLNIPLDTIETKAANLIEDKDAEIFVYCLSGKRSRVACKLLAHMGYTNVTDIGAMRS